MSGVRIDLLCETDAEPLLAFEQENRVFFARTIGDRGDEYFNLAYIRRMLAEVIEEQSRGLRYMYLMRDEAGQVVGRINLHDVARDDLPRAELGYRVGERHNGRGYATAALRLVLAEAFGAHCLERVEASTVADNVASQIVLLKNGFQFVDRSPRYLKINGQWADFVHFAKENPHEQ